MLKGINIKGCHKAGHPFLLMETIIFMERL